MRTVWCMVLYFFGARAKITQTSSLVLKEDENATLKCSQNYNHDYMYWYLQQAGKGLQLIYYSYGTNQDYKGDVHIGYEAKRLSQEEFCLNIVSVKKNHSAVYFCASSLVGHVNNDRLFFGTGTKLTVIGKNDEIIPPAVAIFSPSKQEIQQKNKATLVCLASGFYPDNLNLVWKVNGVKRTEGVGTDETSTSNGSTYALTSRLRISAQEWFNPLNRFECTAEFFKNKTLEPIHKFIYGDTGCMLTKESYLRHGNSMKLTYLILCGKAFLYAVLVCALMWTVKRFYVMLIVAGNSGTSSKYCANSPLSFGQGTHLTVLGKNDEIIPPAVAIFSPSKQEIQQKNKATLVCLASGFYPDNLNLVWKVNGVKRTEGVGTDETSTSNGSTYALTSRLRISAQEWFNPLNRFECTAEFFKNKTLEPIHKFIYGDTGCDIFRENYQRTATAGKFVYIMLIFKSILYGIFVFGMMLWYKRLLLDPVLFDIFVSDLNECFECIDSKFADDTKLGEVASMLEGCANSTVRPGETRELVKKELYEVQGGQMKSPSPGEE
ncbi:M1-specific T cell receptor beta chain-like [Excalfactoria chinensis]|uniref:M1-specific T cell receptor beta chain-like n=1 Tax=Excalfactoria chinensis TaxID=46218 RepID=UPI003B3B6527